MREYQSIIPSVGLNASYYRNQRAARELNAQLGIVGSVDGVGEITRTYILCGELKALVAMLVTELENAEKDWKNNVAIHPIS